MGGRAGDWSETERDAFWRFVRGRMAELRLTQETVAGALDIDRSVLGRRLSGQIKERPSETMLERLTVVLQLDSAGREHLRALAGYPVAHGRAHAVSSNRAIAPARQPGDRQSALAVRDAVSHADPSLGATPWPAPGRRPGRRWIVASVLALLLAAIVVTAANSGAVWLLTTVSQVSSASAAAPPSGTVAGWLLFRRFGEQRSSHAWVTIWYRDPRRGWRDRSVQVRDGENPLLCGEYLALAGLSSPTGACYQFLDIPKTSKVQVRIHYERDLIRDYYFDFGGPEPLYWVGTTSD